MASSDFGSISLKHAGRSDFGQRFIDATFRIVEDTPKVLEQIEAWKQLALPAPVQKAYADAAQVLLDVPNVTPDQLLAPGRNEDKPEADGTRSLWATFNTGQESILKGGITGTTPTGCRMTTRPVKAVERDICLNKVL